MLSSMARTKRRTRVSDRERIAEAFGELMERGYLLPFPGWEICCTNCGWREVAHQLGMDERDDDDFPADFKTVWWHEQADSLAFCMDADAFPQTEEFAEKIPEDDFEEWFEAHAEEAAADSIIARTTEYATLLGPLFIHWRGDSSEVAAALRARGLRVRVPDEDDKCIIVMPEHSMFHADPVNGEVMLHLDGDEFWLPVEDAKRLARKLTRAARSAEAQLPGL